MLAETVGFEPTARMFVHPSYAFAGRRFQPLSHVSWLNTHSVLTAEQPQISHSAIHLRFVVRQALLLGRPVSLPAQAFLLPASKT
jgi:hypothetical protein